MGWIARVWYCGMGWATTPCLTAVACSLLNVANLSRGEARASLTDRTLSAACCCRLSRYDFISGGLPQQNASEGRMEAYQRKHQGGSRAGCDTAGRRAVGQEDLSAQHSSSCTKFTLSRAGFEKSNVLLT